MYTYVCVLYTVDLVFMLCCKLRVIIVVCLHSLTSIDVCFTGAFCFLQMATLKHNYASHYLCLYRFPKLVHVLHFI